MLPWVIVRILPTVILPVNVTPDTLFTVRLLRFATLDGIKTPALVPPNTRLDDADVVKFDGVPAIVGPLNVRIYVPTVKEPDARAKVPYTEVLPCIVLLPLPEIVRLV